MSKRTVPFWRRWFSWWPRRRASDRRDALRYPCSLATSCHVVASLVGSSGTAKVRNLSAGGISLVLDHGVEPHSTVSVQLVNTKRNDTCTVQVRVIYNIEHPSGEWIVGGAFTRPLRDEELQAFLM